MPAILAIDTTIDACSLALVTPRGIKESVSLAAREHTQHLLPMVDTLLKEAGIALSELDAIAYGCGPGSFTGLRICLSVAQGLAYGADLPLIPISSLHTMAVGALRLQQPAHPVIVPAIDARMNEVYWSAYRVTEGGLETLLAEQVSSPDECAQQLLALPVERVYGVGSGWHEPVLQGLAGAEFDTEFYPRAYDVAEMALALYDKGQSVAAMAAQPTYLRNKIHWKKRERIRQQ